MKKERERESTNTLTHTNKIKKIIYTTKSLYKQTANERKKREKIKTKEKERERETHTHTCTHTHRYNQDRQETPLTSAGKLDFLSGPLTKYSPTST